MDHRRIEWLFLIVFLLIDLYLGLEIIQSPVRLSHENINNSSKTDMRMEMRQDNIELPHNLSTTNSAGYYLAAKKHDYLSNKINSLNQIQAHYVKNSNSLIATPKMNLYITGSQTHILQKLNLFKDDAQNVPYGTQFKYEPSLSNNNNYTFVQNCAYGSVYDPKAQLTIALKHHLLTSYTLTYLGPIEPVRELQSTISPWHALKAMYTDRQLVNNSRVLKIKLGYSELTQVRGSIILLPTWLVWIENKTTKNITLKRVNAYTGQTLQTSMNYSVAK